MTVKTAGKIKKSHLSNKKSWISLLNSAQICKKHSVNQVNFHLHHYAANNPIKYTDPDGRDIGDWQDNGDGTWTVISEGATLWDVWGSDAYKVTGLSKSVKKSLKEIFLKDPSILTKLQKALKLNKENIIIMIGEEAYQFFSDLVLTKDAGKSFVEYYGY